jgi:hypothetical protein
VEGDGVDVAWRRLEGGVTATALRFDRSTPGRDENLAAAKGSVDGGELGASVFSAATFRLEAAAGDQCGRFAEAVGDLRAESLCVHRWSFQGWVHEGG